MRICRKNKCIIIYIIIIFLITFVHPTPIYCSDTIGSLSNFKYESSETLSESTQTYHYIWTQYDNAVLPESETIRATFIKSISLFCQYAPRYLYSDYNALAPSYNRIKFSRTKLALTFRKPQNTTSASAIPLG